MLTRSVGINGLIKANGIEGVASTVEETSFTSQDISHSMAEIATALEEMAV